MAFKNQTQITWWSLWYVENWWAVASTITKLTGTNWPTVRWELDALTRTPFWIIWWFNYSHVFEDEEEINALDCNEQTFFKKVDQKVNMQAILLQNNNIDTLSYIIWANRETNEVTPAVLTEEYMSYEQQVSSLLPWAYRFVSCAYQVDTDADNLLWRRDYVYFTNMFLWGEVVEQYFAKGDTFEWVTIDLNWDVWWKFMKVIARGATSSDV